MMIRMTSLCLILTALVVGTWQCLQHPRWSDFQSQTPLISPITLAHSNIKTQSHFIPNSGGKKLHAASIIALNNGNLMAFWFEGSREGARDVVIQSAIFDNHTKQWQQPEVVIDREITQQKLWRYIDRLGNPVPMRTEDGKLQLSFVTTSIGGWSTSSITTLVSEDEGETWHSPQRLITSPFFNLSTLVKSPAITFQDNHAGLPVYHELFAKFGELLRLETRDTHITVLDKRRMSWGRGTLQPIIFIDNEKNATAYFRQARMRDTEPKRIMTSQTVDAGDTWREGENLFFPNPNAAIAGVTLVDGSRVLVFNDLERGRYRLVLAISQYQQGNYSPWRVIQVLEDDSGLPENERRRFSYPYLITDQRGDVHLLYTWDSNKIKHTFFAATYLQTLMHKAQHE